MDMIITIPWWLPTLIGVLGIGFGYAAHIIMEKMVIVAADKTARRLLQDARLQAEVITKEATLKARDELLALRREFEQETRQQRERMREGDERLARRETMLDQKLDMLDQREHSLEKRRLQLEQALEKMEAREQELERLRREEEEQLQRLAGMNREQARAQFLRRMEDAFRTDAEMLLRRIQEDTLATAETRAREIVTQAIQRIAAPQTADVTTSAVSLPSEDMKGRIIGREGRNIRCFEAATGVDVLIDETPEVVVLSSFDPLRREVARQALEHLIADGRIHPATIEEAVTQARTDIEKAVENAGREALFELGLRGVSPELTRTLGRLQFRHSHAQNVLRHSIETAHLMALMAAELGLDPDTAKRIGVFHDIGKAVDHTTEGGHALIGAEVLRRQGEDAQVYQAVAAHHNDIQNDNLYAKLVTAADAITASRPGARAENTEGYLKRLSQLETIANRFEGVAKSFAIQAGRELRVVVEPAQVDDPRALQLAREISRAIEQEMRFPGQIRVTVIRETRCVEYAH